MVCDALESFCDGRIDYRARGVHVRLETRWEWRAQQGDDTHTAIYRGSRSRLELRQGAAEAYRPELYVVAMDGVPPGEIGAALERRTTASQAAYPGISAERRDGEWRVGIPDALRVGHEANFAQFTRRFLAYVEDPPSLPQRATLAIRLLLRLPALFLLALIRVYQRTL